MTRKNIEKIPLQNLSIFRLKGVPERWTDVLDDPRLLQHYSVRAGGVRLGDIYVRPPKSNPPRWATLFDGSLDLSIFGRASSTAAVLFVTRDGCAFALTFGQGRHRLRSYCWDERFGLLVALNSIGERQLRSVDKQSFDAFSSHSRIQVSKETGATDFGLDIERDLLRAVIGTPKSPALGQRLGGFDVLQASARVSLSDIPTLLDTYERQFHSHAYRTNFSWVDHVRQVRDKAQVARLDERLVEKIVEEPSDRCWLAVPDVIDWTEPWLFRYGMSRRHPELHDISLRTFLESERDPKNLTLATLHARHVIGTNADGMERLKWPVYRCLYAEIDQGKDTYLLNGGVWYRIAKDFVAEVNQAYSNIPLYDRDLPVYDDETETAYNARVAQEDPSRFAAMDRKNRMYGGGKSKVEFCDLYTDDRDIIHVKRYGSASNFSHQFSQGVVSGESFQMDSGFRNLVNSALPSSHAIARPQDRPDRDAYRVVFAVVSEATEALRLPFFSRVTLRHAYRSLVGFGFRVCVAKIEVAPNRARLKKYPSFDRGAKRRGTHGRS